MSTELVLLVSDLFIPLRIPEIDIQFKSILIPNKIQHIICLGNIGSQETFDWLQGLSSNFHVVQGDYDFNRKLPEKKAIQVGNFRIGMLHGHQIIPMGDLEMLSNVQRELDCDILVSGYTHELTIKTKENKLYLNPGSFSGALSPLVQDCVPSFILMALQGEEATIYTYVLSDKNKKFQVGQIEYYRGSNELKIIKEISGDDNGNENENENEIKEEKENENNENEKKDENENNINNEEKNDLENEENEQQNQLIQDNKPSSLIQNQQEESKEAENNDEKMDE